MTSQDECEGRLMYTAAERPRREGARAAQCIADDWKKCQNSYKARDRSQGKRDGCRGVNPSKASQSACA